MSAEAWLEATEGTLKGHPIKFQWNPTQYSIANTLTYSAQKSKGKNGTQQEFEKGERTLNLELFIDTYEKKADWVRGSPSADASKVVARVESLTLADKTIEPGKLKKPRPPHVKFGWGSHTPPYEWIITSTNVTYTLFHEDGIPARAKLKLTLKEALALNDGKGTNPTSGGMAGRTSHRVRPGETLDQIAFTELGDAALWPYIAELNRLDDPWHLEPGRFLAIAQPD